MKRSIWIILLIYIGWQLDAQKFPQLSPVTVIDGQELLNPWAGGSNNPQVSAINLNNDQLQDLFVMDRYGSRILPFVAEDDGVRLNYRYSPKYLKNFPVLYDWALLRDYNKDGIMDIFASSAINQGPFGIEVYKGLSDGTFELVRFPTLQHDILYYRGSNNRPINVYVSWDDIPDINDIDGDGDIDVLGFEPNANVMNWYQNMAVEKGFGIDTFIFELTDRCWGKFEESESSKEITLSTDPNECASGLISNEPRSGGGIHAGSTTVTFDQDGDGDVEAIIGDLTSRGLVLLKNGGTPTKAWMTDQDTTYPSYDIPVEIEIFNAPYLVDINQDGVRDLIVAPNEILAEDIRGQWYYVGYKQGDEHFFSLEQSDFFSEDMIDLGSGCRPYLVDYNADGLLDIVAGNDYRFLEETDKQSRLVVFENTGSATQPSFELVDDDYLGLSEFSGNSSATNYTHYTPAFGDLDGDGDLDLLVGTQRGELIYFNNRAGAGAALDFGNPQFDFQSINPGGLAVPCIVDIDEDGLGDILLGNKVNNTDQQGTPCGSFFYFHNIGSLGNPQFDSDIFAGLNDPCFGRQFFRERGSAVESSPFVYDFPGNRRIYLGTNQGIKVLDGVSDTPGEMFDVIDQRFGDIHSDQTLHITLGDLTGDGGLEAVVGHKTGGMTVYKTDHRVDGTVNLRETRLSGVSIRSNPVQHQIELKGADNAQVVIYDVHGHRVWSGENQTKIAVASWPEGIYLVHVTRAQQSWTGKVIKQ